MKYPCDMRFKIGVHLFGVVSISLGLVGCKKETTVIAPTPKIQYNYGIRCSSMEIYEGDTLTKLPKIEDWTFKYDYEGRIIFKTQRYFKADGSVALTNLYDYKYDNQWVTEAYTMDFNNMQNLLEKKFIKLNALGRMVMDSTIDLSRPNSPTVRKYLYDAKNHLTNDYFSDTLDGRAYGWTGNNLTHNFLMNGLMGRFLTQQDSFGILQNSLDFGDFWESGMRSANLPEKRTEPNYQYTFDYKMDPDGFVTEQLMSVINPTTGKAYHYEKRIFKR